MEDSIPFFKVRLFLGACLFAVFFYCYHTDTKICDLSATQVMELISDNHYYTNLKNYVMMSANEKERIIFE